MTYRYANFAESSLLTVLKAAATELEIRNEDVATFPELVSGESFLLTIFDGNTSPEIVLVTAIVANVLTITRGQEDTTATQWDAGAMVRLAPTAAQFEAFWNALGGNEVVEITSSNGATAFAGWDRRRGAGEVVTGASSFNVALPTTATLYDEIMISKTDSSAGVATFKQGSTTIATLSAQFDWKLLRWDGAAWGVVAGTTVGPTGAAGSNGSNGTDGKTILSGTSTPTTEGVNGDFYIKNPATAPMFYGPKAAGVWGSGITLVGPSGPGSGDMLKTDNLSGLADYPAARSNLGLGNVATRNIGTASGTAAAGDDSRFSGLAPLDFTGNKTLALTDLSQVMRHTAASDHALTIPPNGTVAFAVGVLIPVRCYGAGKLTITRGAGVALRAAGSGSDSNIILSQYVYRVLWQEAADVWVLL